MADPLEDLIDLLDLEVIEDDIFRGAQPRGANVPPLRVFGGQVAGQALVAAARTVDPDRSVHSLHAYFLRPGDVSIPIVYDVDRIRDGRSFTTRRVVAIQHGRAIFNLQASFQVAEAGYEHQEPMPNVPLAHEVEGFSLPKNAIELRHVEGRSDGREAAGRRTQHVWFRTMGALPDDPILHACVLTYASDMTLLHTALLPHGTVLHDPRLQQASIDHVIWFHRPFRADEWLLYAQETPSASGARGLVRGSIFTSGGQLVASVAQEGLLRMHEHERTR